MQINLFKLKNLIIKIDKNFLNNMILLMNSKLKIFHRSAKKWNLEILN